MGIKCPLSPSQERKETLQTDCIRARLSSVVGKPRGWKTEEVDSSPAAAAGSPCHSGQDPAPSGASVSVSVQWVQGGKLQEMGSKVPSKSKFPKRRQRVRGLLLAHKRPSEAWLYCRRGRTWRSIFIRAPRSLLLQYLSLGFQKATVRELLDSPWAGTEQVHVQWTQGPA